MNTFSLYYNGITNTNPNKQINVQEFIELIKQDNPLVAKARTLTDKKERDAIKAKMSYVTFGGIFSSRSNKNLLKSSGLACFDIDELTNLTELRNKLVLDKYTHLLFVSPSGNGLKIVVKIPEVSNDEEYKQYWNSIEEYYNFPKKENGKNTSDAIKDISRACYLSVDKEPYFNPNSKVYTDKFIPEPAKQVIIPTAKGIQKSENLNGNSNEFLDKLKSSVSMEQVLSNFGVDTSMNPTNCIFHNCSQRCLSFNNEVAHCFDSDCATDSSWNIFSFVKKVKGYNSSEAIEWLSEFAGMQKEYEESKKKYLEEHSILSEPKGWACSINIKRMAERSGTLICSCGNPFEFDERLGYYKCSKCKSFGNLKKFAELIVKNKLVNTGATQ